MIDHYAVNKFFYDTDRNEQFIGRYIDDPDSYVDWYFQERLGRLLGNESERSGVRTPDEETRTALKTYDFAALYRDGAHPFILWTLMLPVLEAKVARGELTLPAGAQDPGADAEGAPVAPSGTASVREQIVRYYRAGILPYGRPDFRY